MGQQNKKYTEALHGDDGVRKPKLNQTFFPRLEAFYVP